MNEILVHCCQHFGIVKLWLRDRNIILCTWCHLSPLSNINVAGSTVPFSSQVKLLDVTLDSSLSVNKHVAYISKSCFFHLRARYATYVSPSLMMRRRPSPARSSGHGLTTLTPYWLARHSKTSTGCSISREHTGVDCYEGTIRQIRNVSTKHLLSTLHWLSVRRRIDFKISVLTYKLLSTGQSSCLACKITPYVSGRRLRSSDSGTLTVPRIKSAIGLRAFCSAAPSVWNLVRAAPSLESFRVKFKTH